MMWTMRQEPEEQLRRYMVQQKVAHIRAYKLSTDEQQGFSEIMEFAMMLQPVIHNKLLNKIDENRPHRILRKA